MKKLRGRFEFFGYVLTDIWPLAVAFLIAFGLLSQFNTRVNTWSEKSPLATFMQKPAEIYDIRNNNVTEGSERRIETGF